MRKRSFAIACLVAIVLSNGQYAVCAPSGLNTIPTADILDQGVVSLETESDGNGQPWGNDCDTFALLQFGVGHGLELGVDRGLNDSTAWLNFKWRFRDEHDGYPALAVGSQAITDDGRPQTYIVATKSLRDTRLHTGFIDIDSKLQWMVGLDHPLSSRAVFQTDYISGGENSMTFGIAVNLSDSLSLNLARSVGNRSDTGNGQIVNLAWSMPLH